MKKLIFYLLPAFFLFHQDVKAQYRGFTDRFEDGTFELARRGRNRNAPPYIIWNTCSPGTYHMEEIDGLLRIGYSRLEGIGAFDRFTMTPPFPVDVKQNPHIQVKIKSPIAFNLTLQPVYSMKPPTYEEITKEIPGDNQWHTYTFKLYDYLYERFSVQSVEFFFDRGSVEANQGVVEMDDVRIGWYLIEVTDLEADILDGTDIHLTWHTNNPENTGKCKVYRGEVPRFEISEDRYIGESENFEFVDPSPGSYGLFYYRILPFAKDGEEFLPSGDVRAETYAKGEIPTVSIEKINTPRVKKYEKFELTLSLDHVGIHNPFDPEDIDVYAVFRSPAGDSLRINAFYDNYRNADTWKLRFSPSRTGDWSYEVYVHDAGGTGKTERAFFNVIESDHHGWIRPSVKNRHYFTHDDGTSYYAIGVYSPWGNTAERFRTFADHKANFFAIWDIGYGGFVNETGIIEEELGKYNQEKCGRIDSLLTILEADDIQLMYAIWPHDLFSETVWAAEWDKNPYREIVDVVDVYDDELAWRYQEKKYRYLIARFSHSRSMGIWELINEMNGTDGWKEARYEAAYNWVQKADRYFEENDPYNHPVTASFSGGFTEYREALYERNDVPNIHFYPAQGWPLKYPDDTIRSSLYNYAWATQRFWENFNKPALFGEAGADLDYFKRDDPKYHEAYHNAIWATLSNGLAGIPVWWEFRHLSERDWDHLSYLADFITNIDFANLDYDPTRITGEGVDGYGMNSGNSGFGWACSYVASDIGHTKLDIQVPEGEYQIIWFDTWEGKNIKTVEASSGYGSISIEVPGLSEPRKDIAFKWDRINK